MPRLSWLKLVDVGFFSIYMASRGSMIITFYYEDKENVKIRPIILKMTYLLATFPPRQAITTQRSDTRDRIFNFHEK